MAEVKGFAHMHVNETSFQARAPKEAQRKLPWRLASPPLSQRVHSTFGQRRSGQPFKGCIAASCLATGLWLREKGILQNCLFLSLQSVI